MYVNKIKSLFVILLHFLFLNLIYLNCSAPHSEEYVTVAQSNNIETPDVPIVPEEPVEPAKPSSECVASNYAEIQKCLSLASSRSSKDVLFKIKLVASRIILESSQVIRMSGLSNVEILGAANFNDEYPVTISETTERMQDSHVNSRHFIEIIGESTDITISNIHIEDQLENKNTLRSRCITGTHPDPTKPNLWDPTFCYAPILVGSSNANTNEYTKSVNLKKISISSAKAILLEIRRTLNLVVQDSLFKGGTVYGIFMHASFKHVNTSFLRNHISEAGTSGLSIVNTFNTVIAYNTLINNHIIPQYAYTDAKGQIKFYPGGQLYLATVANAPSEYIRVFNNNISMTAPYIEDGMAYGIEIMNGVAAPIENVIVENNDLHNISRGGISVHNADHVGQRKIIIRNNRLTNVAKAFPALPASAYVHTEILPSFPYVTHRHVDIYNNVLSKNEGPAISASFMDTVQNCVVPSGDQTCGVEIKWKVAGFPSAVPRIIRVNGLLHKNLSTANTGSFTANLRSGHYVYSIHTSSSDTHPVAIINIIVTQ